MPSLKKSYETMPTMLPPSRDEYYSSNCKWLDRLFFHNPDIRASKMRQDVPIPQMTKTSAANP